MKKLRNAVVVLAMLACCSVAPAAAEVNIGIGIGIGLPNISIGINLPVFPHLVPVPGYPVYYAPSVASNYFFYDGMYWVYQDDYWYASYWYNGPWWGVDPGVVPVYILRIPVRYYRYPPPYFHGWRPDAPPRWGEYWGPLWEQHRSGWDKWNRNAAPSRAPLPLYQRQYAGDRYPQAEQQQRLHQQHYRYQPRTKAIRQQYQQQGMPGGTAPSQQRWQPQQQPMQHPQGYQQGMPGGPSTQQPRQPVPQQRGPIFQEQRPQGQEPRWQPPRGQGQGPPWQRKDGDQGR